MRPAWLRSEHLIVVVSFVVLVVVSVVNVVARQPVPPALPYLSTSPAPGGSLALYTWLGAIDAVPKRLEKTPLDIHGLDTLFVLEPRTPYSQNDLAAVTNWVSKGGALVMLLDDKADARLPQAFGLNITALGFSTGTGRAASAPAPVQPLLAHPPLGALSVTPSAYIQSASPEVVPLLAATRTGAGRGAASLADSTRPVLVYRAFGRGRVYAGTVPSVFSNKDIGRGDNRLLALNILAGKLPGGRVGFDDAHILPHVSEMTQAVSSLTDAIGGTGWGRALLYALALLALYILFTGRRLGRALPAMPDRGRSLSEYVVSMAGIFRRAHLRGAVLTLWQDDLRRTLAGPGGRRERDDAALIDEAIRRADLSPDEREEALKILTPVERLSEQTLIADCRSIDRLRERAARR